MFLELFDFKAIFIHACFQSVCLQRELFFFLF